MTDRLRLSGAGDVLLDWVSAAPKTRAGLVAGEIDIIETKRSSDSALEEANAGAATLSSVAARC